MLSLHPATQRGFRPSGTLDAIRQFYDRLIAAFVLAALVLVSSVLLLQVASLQRLFTTNPGRPPPPSSPTLHDPSLLARALGVISTPPSWDKTDEHRGLFVPPVVLKQKDGSIRIINEKDELVGNNDEGLPKAWLHRYGLSIYLKVADTDSDHDGFTVREEYGAETNPTDASSHPDMAVKLRVTRLTEGVFPFIFNGVQESQTGLVFALLRRDLTKQYFVRMNEAVPDRDFPGYKVVAFQPKSEKRPDILIKDENGLPWVTTVDVSELTLQREREAPVVFVKNKVTHSGRFTARLSYLLGKKTFDVNTGTSITLEGNDYQVLGIKPGKNGAPEVEIKIKKEDAPILILHAPSRLEQQQIEAMAH